MNPSAEKVTKIPFECGSIFGICDHILWCEGTNKHPLQTNQFPSVARGLCISNPGVPVDRILLDCSHGVAHTLTHRGRHTYTRAHTALIKQTGQMVSCFEIFIEQGIT